MKTRKVFSSLFAACAVLAVSVGVASTAAVEEGCTPAQVAEVAVLTETEVNCVISHYGEPAVDIVLACLGPAASSAKKDAAQKVLDGVGAKVEAAKRASR